MFVWATIVTRSSHENQQNQAVVKKRLNGTKQFRKKAYYVILLISARNGACMSFTFATGCLSSNVNTKLLPHLSAILASVVSNRPSSTRPNLSPIATSVP